MPTNSAENQVQVREAFAQSLGLKLTDSAVAALLEGKALSLEQLAENNSLTEIGAALIRLDALRQGDRGRNQSEKKCPEGQHYVWPFGCVGGDIKQIPPITLSSDWLE